MCLALSESSYLTLALFIWSVAITAILAWSKLREKARKSDYLASAKIIWLKDIEAQCKSIKDAIAKMDVIDKETTDKIIKIDIDSALYNTKIKSIFHRLGDITSEITNSLNKMEINLREEIKEVKRESKEERKELKAHIAKLYDKMQDKK